jgi:hypothetical protein
MGATLSAPQDRSRFLSRYSKYGTVMQLDLSKQILKFVPNVAEKSLIAAPDSVQ